MHRGGWLSRWWQWWRGAGCVPWHEVNGCSVTARTVPVPASRSWQGELCPACDTGSGAAPSLCRLQRWHLSLAHGGWIPFAAFLPRVSFALKTCLPDGLRWDTMPSVFLSIVCLLGRLAGLCWIRNHNCSLFEIKGRQVGGLGPRHCTASGFPSIFAALQVLVSCVFKK